MKNLRVKPRFSLYRSYLHRDPDLPAAAGLKGNISLRAADMNFYLHAETLFLILSISSCPNAFTVNK